MVAKQSTVSLKWAFPVSCFFACFATAFFPHIRLVPFAPFLALIIMEKKLIHALWIAAACGLFLDLLQYQDHFGLYALGHVLATLVLYKQRRLLFFHKQFSLPLFATLFALIASGIHYLSLIFTGTPPFTSWGWLIADTFSTSLLDGLATALFYSLPFELYHRFLAWKAKRKEEAIAE